MYYLTFALLLYIHFPEHMHFLFFLFFFVFLLSLQVCLYGGPQLPKRKQLKFKKVKKKKRKKKK